jgi:outer membrane usher protein
VHAADDVLAQLQSASTARQSAVLEAIVNGRPHGPVFAVVERGEAVGIDAAALRQWRVVQNGTRTFVFEERAYVPVAELAGVKVNVEQKTQRLLVEVPPALLSSTDLSFAGRRAEPSPAIPSALLNYTLFGYSSHADSYGSGYFEAGISGSLGSLFTTASANTASAFGDTTHRIVRYDTAFRRDDAGGLTTLTLGDSFTQPGAWGRSVRFGGIQYGTNFTLQPNLITYPLQGFTGTAVVPSTVDVFVNGSRIASQPVQPGPFTLNDVPLVNGAGDVQLVVRDAFGQQQIVTQPFYASRRLLKSGLDEFQVNAGAIRENYGLASFDYGSAMGSAYWRRGVNDQFTFEARGEADQHVTVSGLTGDFGIGLLGTLTAGVAVSGGDVGSGRQWLAGYEYFGRYFSFAARSTWASDEFRMLGDDHLPVLRRQSFASVGTNFGAAGSLGLAWAAQRYRLLPGLDTVALTYTATFARNAFVTASVQRTLSVIDQTSFFATLTFALDNRASTTAEASGTRGGGRSSSYGAWSAQQTLPTDQGFGYRVRTTTNEQYEAGIGYTWPYGTYSLEAATSGGSSATRATATGGIGYVGGRGFASRMITDSFGLVEVGNIPGVLVYNQGNPIGRTDDEGRIILHRLTPYVANRITIDERDLPLDVVIRHRELHVVPQYRAGVLASYDAHRRVSVVLEVFGPDGRHLPAGTNVQLEDPEAPLLVGDNGEMYVPDLPAVARFVATWRGVQCRFEARLEAPPSELLPKLGPYHCREAR